MGQIMAGGPVRMTVNQRVGLGGAQPVATGLRVKVGIRRSAAFVCFALAAQRASYFFAFTERLGQKIALPGRTVHLIAKLDVVGVSQAQGIAMREQPALARKFQHSGVVDQGEVCLLYTS